MHTNIEIWFQNQDVPITKLIGRYQCFLIDIEITIKNYRY